MKVKDLPSSECTEKKLKEMRKARKTSPYRNAITVLQLSRHIKGLLKLDEEALKKNPKKQNFGPYSQIRVMLQFNRTWQLSTKTRRIDKEVGLGGFLLSLGS